MLGRPREARHDDEGATKQSKKKSVANLYVESNFLLPLCGEASHGTYISHEHSDVPRRA